MSDSKGISSDDPRPDGAAGHDGRRSPAEPPPLPAMAPPAGQPPQPVIPLTEPGVVMPAPFADVYSMQSPAGPEPVGVPAHPSHQGYYPPPVQAQSFGVPPENWIAPIAIDGRPGLLTALAICSMVIAGLSLIGSFMTGCTTTRLLASAREEVAEGGNSELGLSERDLKAIVNEVVLKSNNQLSAQQRTQLARYFNSKRVDSWITPASTTAGLTSQVQLASVSHDGHLVIQFQMATVRLDPSGSIVQETASTRPSVSAPTTMATSPPAWMYRREIVVVDTRACSSLIRVQYVSGMLALVLLALGILMLGKWRWVRLAVFLWAGSKIALEAWGLLLLTRIGKSIAADGSGNVPVFFVAEMMRTAVKTWTWFTAIGLIFPLAALVLMMVSGSVKGYYRRA